MEETLKKIIIIIEANGGNSKVKYFLITHTYMTWCYNAP